MVYDAAVVVEGSDVGGREVLGSEEGGRVASLLVWTLAGTEDEVVVGDDDDDGTASIISVS